MGLLRDLREGRGARLADAGGRHTVTRRGLIKGTAAVGATAAVASVLAGCRSSDEGANEPVMVDSSAADYVIDPNTNESRFDSKESSLSPAYTWDIALGSVLHPTSDSTWIPMTCAGSSAMPMVRASALSITTGAVVDVVAAPHTEPADNVVIYDVRCSDSVYAWAELNLLTRAWRLYAARFEGGEITGSTTTLWEASADYDPPRFAVAGTLVIWYVMPSASGGKSGERSFCYQWRVGDDKDFDTMTGEWFAVWNMTLSGRIKHEQEEANG